jgi:hypothetical protein
VGLEAAMKQPRWAFSATRDGELQADKTHDGLGIDVPLLVFQDSSARLRKCFRKGIKRGVAAPLQLVSVELYDLKELAELAKIKRNPPAGGDTPKNPVLLAVLQRVLTTLAACDSVEFT